MNETLAIRERTDRRSVLIQLAAAAALIAALFAINWLGGNL